MVCDTACLFGGGDALCSVACCFTWFIETCCRRGCSVRHFVLTRHAISARASRGVSPAGHRKKSKAKQQNNAAGMQRVRVTRSGTNRRVKPRLATARKSSCLYGKEGTAAPPTNQIKHLRSGARAAEANPPQPHETAQHVWHV